MVPIFWCHTEVWLAPGYLEILESSFIVAKCTLDRNSLAFHLNLARHCRPSDSLSKLPPGFIGGNRELSISKAVIQGVLRCEDHYLTFYSRDQQAKHMASEHPKEPKARVQCMDPTCDNDFVDREVELAHFGLQHAENIPIYSCESCGFATKYEHTLKTLVQNVHTSESRGECPKGCGAVLHIPRLRRRARVLVLPEPH